MSTPPPDPTYDPAPLAAGDGVSVEDPLTGITAVGRVTAVEGDTMTLELPLDAPRRSGRIGIRRLDAEGAAWYGETVCRPGTDDLHVIATVPGSWEVDAVRRSARVALGRQPIIVETPPPNPVRWSLTATDISGTGLGAAGVGMPLKIGVSLRVTFDVEASFPRWLHAVVVWSAPRGSDRFDVGLRFTPESPEEQALALRWRDAAART